MRTSIVSLVVCGFLAGLVACEEGPEQIYTPNPKDIDLAGFNGGAVGGHTTIGEQKFEYQSSGKVEDNKTTKICEADELAKVWTKMVKEPIIPNKGAGGLDLKGKNWAGLTIDDAQKTLCQAVAYDSTLYYWGDNNELIAIFDSETRLISYLVVLPGYEGTIKAGDWVVELNEPLMLKGKKVADPFGDSTLRDLNIAMLKAFRPEVKNPDSIDCVKLNTCKAVTVQTSKRLLFSDFGTMEISIEPVEQKIDAIFVGVDRTFTITQSDVKFAAGSGTNSLVPVPTIDHTTGCQLTLGKTWDYFTQNCIGTDPPEKATAGTTWSGEGVYATLGQGSIYMTRPSLKADAIIPEKSRPDKSDVIVGMFIGNYWQGDLHLNRDELYKAYWARVAADVTLQLPTVDMTTLFAKLKPKGDATKLSTGAQKIEDCTGTGSCDDATLTIGTRKVVTAEVKKLVGAVPDSLMNPNFYTEHFLRELAKMFNDGVEPTTSELRIFANYDNAIDLYATLSRLVAGKRTNVRFVYDNKEDEISYFYFTQGELRAEKVLFKDQDLMGNKLFKLSDFIKSPRLGLAKKLFPKKTLPKLRMATIEVDLGATTKTEVLVNYHAEDSLSGYSIPIEGKRDLFVPASYFGLNGLTSTVRFWADGDDGIIKAISSSSFFDKLDFCGVKVGIWDNLQEVLKKLPASCDKLLSYSSNGKILYGASTYIQTTPYKIGLRLSTTAGRIDGATYWAE